MLSERRAWSAGSKPPDTGYFATHCLSQHHGFHNSGKSPTSFRWRGFIDRNATSGGRGHVPGRRLNVGVVAFVPVSAFNLPNTCLFIPFAAISTPPRLAFIPKGLDDTQGSVS